MDRLCSVSSPSNLCPVHHVQVLDPRNHKEATQRGILHLSGSHWYTVFLHVPHSSDQELDYTTTEITIHCYCHPIPLHLIHQHIDHVRADSGSQTTPQQVHFLAGQKMAENLISLCSISIRIVLFNAIY